MAPPPRIGRYVVEGKLGAGGMGVVFRARDEALDRTVALKLLRGPSQRDPHGRARLQREAKAMAQLSHPNVVQVYDVGQWQDRDFVALEYIEGMTLATWLESQTRTWPEIVAVFVQAGRGLAAAHACGLVHRDFKPDNVLLDAHGRARVVDFGLARAGDPEPDASESEVRPSGSHPKLTSADSLLGTPAYMAPEQFLRMPADARSDQFAFCVALYEALYGSRPFAGKTIDEIGQNVVFGQLIAPPRTAVPQWLERVVLRGLSSQADDRFPSMPALLAELDRDRRRGRRLLAVGAGALVLGMAGALVLTTGGGEVCEGAAERLAGAWDPTRSAAVERALLATGVPFAGDTWARTRAGLEAYAQQWQEMHRDACLDHRRGEQSSVALDLRMVCLQRRRTELAALVTMLTEADAQTVTNATQAVAGLAPIAGCGDLAGLLDEQRRLAAPTDPSRAAEVEALRGTLAQVEALMLAGQYSRGLTVAEQAVGAAQRSGDAAVLAEALLLRGILHMDSGAPEAAESDLWRANLEAIRSGHEQVQARALVKELYVLGHELHEFPAAERAASSATALIARIAADRSIAGELRNNVAVLRSDQGRLDEAIALHRENLEFRRRILPEGHMDIAMTLSNLAVDLQERGRLAEAEPLLRDATAALRTTLGPGHPWTSVARLNLALIRHEAGDAAEAQAILDEALPLLIAAFGADHPLAVEPRAVAAELRLRRGEVEPALRELEQVLPLARASAGLAIRLRVRFTLAQALWDHAPEQRARAVELARAAEQDAAALGTEGSLAAVRAWLAEHH